MSISLPTKTVTLEAVELNRLPGSDLAPEAAQRAVERLQDKVERMRRANELLKKWRPNQAEPAIEQLGFPRSTVTRLITPTQQGTYGFTEAEIAIVEAEHVKAVLQLTATIFGTRSAQ